MFKHFAKHPISFIALILLSLFSFFPLIQDVPLSSPTPQVKSAYTRSGTSVPSFSCSNLPELEALSFYIYDVTSKSVICQREPNLPLYPASTTKMMTALVALDIYTPDQILTVYSADHSVGHTMNLLPDDQLTMSDLIYGLLVSSGNDAALALAENHPQGYSAFVSAMNTKVRALGLKNTYFTNVSGVEDESHITTASDLTTIALEGLKHPLFAQAVATSKTTVTSLQGNSYPLYSTNELLRREDVSGIKTGWTPSAGECLLTLYTQEGHQIIVTLLGSPDRFEETEVILGWLETNLSWE